MLIESNENDIMTFEDTGCVEGCWERDTHENMIGSNYYNVRYGARFPDTKRYGNDPNYVFYGMKKNAWWHGYYTTNYIEAVMYASRMAEAITTYGLTGYFHADRKGYKDADSMGADIELIKWGTELKRINNDNNTKQEDTKGFRRAFLWGMAMHIAADIFSHSSFKGNTYIKHEYNVSALVKDADNINLLPERYDDASEVVRKMLSKYKEGGKSVVAADLLPSTPPTTYNLLYNYFIFSALGQGSIAKYSAYGYNNPYITKL